MPETRNLCRWCHKPVTGRRPQARYCSESHRVQFTRKHASCLPTRAEQTPNSLTLEAPPVSPTGDSLADQIFLALRRAGCAGLTENALAQLCGPHISATERFRALTLLQELGLVTVVHKRTAGLVTQTLWRALPVLPGEFPDVERTPHG
jgi:hypothetical protein